MSNQPGSEPSSSVEPLADFRTALASADIRLTIIDYAGVMDFYAYANGAEFIGIKLNDTVIPPPLTGTWVQGYAYSMSEVQHNADSFIGNRLVHGDAAALDSQINQNIASWFGGVVYSFLNEKYKGYSVHPANLITGINHFDVSISNFSSLCTVTFAIQAIVAGNITNIATRQLTPTLARWAHDFRL